MESKRGIGNSPAVWYHATVIIESERECALSPIKTW